MFAPSWYQYAYLSPYYREGEPVDAASLPWDPAEQAYWALSIRIPAGPAVCVMHLLYALLHKALRDAGVVDFDEPMLQLRNQGVILGEPRPGDCVDVQGTWEGAAFHAERKSRSMVLQTRRRGLRREATRVCGELMDRDETTLKGCGQVMQEV